MVRTNISVVKLPAKGPACIFAPLVSNFCKKPCFLLAIKYSCTVEEVANVSDISKALKDNITPNISYFHAGL